MVKLLPPNRHPDAVTTFQTSKETAHLYRYVLSPLLPYPAHTNKVLRLNGDYNPLHATPQPGQSLGYGGIILHGLYSWNVAAHTVLTHFGNGQGERFVDFEARFVRPVKPGDGLEIKMWDLGQFKGQIEGVDGGRLREVRFEVKVEGRVVLGDGRALLRMEKGESKL